MPEEYFQQAPQLLGDIDWLFVSGESSSALLWLAEFLSIAYALTKLHKGDPAFAGSRGSLQDRLNQSVRTQ